MAGGTGGYLGYSDSRNSTQLCASKAKKGGPKVARFAVVVVLPYLGELRGAGAECGVGAECGADDGALIRGLTPRDGEAVRGEEPEVCGIGAMLRTGAV